MIDIRAVKRTSKGFTIVELLVSLAIITTVTLLVIANLRGGTAGQDLRLAADNLASLIRKAQIQSLAGRQTAGQVPVGGYGVNLAVCPVGPCQVTLFADIDGQLDFDSPQETQETINLPVPIIVSGLNPGSPLSVVFRPPQSIICINQDCSNTLSAIITLVSSQTGQTRNVKVQKISGQVTIE